MTKRKFLPAAICLLSVCALYAFSYPESVRDNLLTIFFPEKTLPVATDHSEDMPAVTVAEPAAHDRSVAAPPDTLPPIRERYDDFLQSGGTNPVDLKDPKAIEQQVDYDPETGMYIITEKIGDDFYRAPTYMTFDEYVRWRDQKQQNEYFDRLQGVVSSDKKSSSGVVDPIAKFDIKNSLIDRLFGGTEVNIKPQGNINLTFGFDYQKIQNPILTLRQQRNGNFDFDMDINMNASGKIGEKLNLNFNYNTQATFDFDNQMKLNYDTKGFSEDEIVQNIEAGNVSMPLRSQLIKGAQNLFGFKTELKFGHLRTTLIASQQRSKQQSLTVQGGSQVQSFEKPIDEYDENRHFFISHYNRDEFEPAMKCLPVPMSLFNITRMEVWITNDKLSTEQFRDIVAVTDLAEPDTANIDDQWALGSPPERDIKNKPLPDNNNNSLYAELTDGLNDDPTGRYNDKVVRRLTNELGMQQIRDFEKMSGRLLSPSEYTYNEQLGFLSVNLNVQPDQVIGVAIEYTYNGIPHKIGEFSSDIPRTSSQDTLNTNVLFVKMLKSTTANIQYPIWDLMMKNIYAIGTANVDPNEFRFDIYYEDPGKGQKRFLGGENSADIPASIRSKPLLQLFRLDTLNLQGDPGPDGIFDFVPGLTINLRSGRIMFPVLEPFGSYLENKLLDAGAPQTVANKYIYKQLYDLTPFLAREFQQFNRFVLKGSYKSSTSSEISLGTFNLPQGSVRVTAGGQLLREGVDYQIDYNIGKVRILNDAILQSGQNVNVSFEDNTLFGFQSRTMLGARFDYELSKDINIGATYMNLFERPLTQKVNFGDDPINNKMYGLDFSISKDAPWLTKIVDKIPFIDTKEPSSISAQAEVAALQPGHNKAINQGGDKGGTVYLDDFEGSTANLPLSNPANSWVIASVPQGDLTEFPEGNDTSLALGANRAGLSWYIADPSARDGVDGENPYTTQIQYQDIFPNRQLTPLEQSALRPLDVTVYPRSRGPYNFDVPGGYPGISAGLTTSGELDQPATRWAGFMRGLNTNDFEAANIEFVEFWVLNPYMEKNDNTNVSDDGNMFIDLGTISEDIMRDSRQFFENTLPTGPGTGATAETPWGRVPVQTPVVNAFDNDPEKRILQDLGLDGLNDDGERTFFSDYVNAIMASSISPNAKDEILADVANDNFVYFRDSRFDGVNPGLLARYRHFNNQQGNSPVNNTDNLNPSATNLPDMEDLDRNNSLNENEAYYRYKINLKSSDQNVPNVPGAQIRGLDLNSPELQDLVTDTVIFQRNGQYYVWYRFKLPLDYQQRQQIGGIQDFRSVRFVRMLWKGFTEQTTFRFATLELGRNQWRRFKQALPQIDVPSGSVCDVGFSQIPFDINAVSIEENSARTPFNYTIPFGIQREQSVGAFPDILQNEQSLSMSVCSLGYCDARAVFKSLNLDLRQYENLKMFVHAEEQDLTTFPFDSSDLTVFMRLGSDYVNNYYEYEIPLHPSKIENLGTQGPDSKQYKEEVWKFQNSFDFPLELLTEVKKQRNASGNTEAIFVIQDPNNPRNKVKVVGNPNLGYVKGVMVGVRNVDPDQQLQCVEVWLNELRLSGFNERGGYAGLARVDMKLADFGNISLAGNYTSIGWGSIEQKLIQRQREEVIQMDASTNLELGKFLPEKSGVKIPFYAQYSNITRNPEYDPYDLDIKLKDKIRDETDPAKKEEIRTLAQDVTTIKGFNFTNVRKERKGGSRKIPLPWNIENFSVTYAYNQQKRRTPFLVNDEQNRYKGALDWQYATGMKPITPFKKLIKNDKYLKFISDFNFNPIPNTYGINTNMERLAGVTTYRFAGEDPSLNTYYNRRFTWDRNYDLGWDISKSLRFNFDATARSLIDEPLEYNNDGTPVSKAERRDSILTNIGKLGRPKNYNHTASLNWTLPFKVIPMMDWISMKATYTAGYNWTAQSLKLQYLDAGEYAGIVNSRSLGNVIQNNNTRQINGDLNFEGLYNKSKYLQKINKPAKKGAKGKTTPGAADDSKSTGGLSPDDDGGGKAAGKRNNKKPGGKEDGKGREAPSDSKDISDKSTDGVTPAAGADGKTAGAEDKKGAKNSNDKNSSDKSAKTKSKDRQPSLAERIALRPLMLVRKGRFTYSENFNTVVPGFTPDTKLMGLSEGFKAPGWAFVAGIQPSVEWLDEAGQKGWITQRPELNQQVTRNYTQNFDAGLTVEPFQDFRVELTANKQYSRNSTELFKDQNFLLDPNEVQFEHRAQRDLGSYTVSYFAMNTLFSKDLNGIFDRYEQYRKVVSQRLGTDIGVVDPHETDEGYVRGYGKIQQQVLIPAFIAAYSDADPQTVGLNIFKTRPAVNWKVNYNGLSKVGNLSKVFASVQISHGYKSTLTVNSYNTDIFYDPSNTYQVDPLNSNYIARYEIPQIVITEQLQPLLGIDIKLKNEMTFKTDLKKSRTLAMSFIDYRLAETQSESYTVGFGYRIKDVNIPFLTGKKAKKGSSKSKKKPAPKPDASPTRPAPAAGGSQPNDVNIKFDFEVRDDITINHQLDQLVEAIPTRGARTISINPSVEYALNRRLKLRFFTDYRKTVPKTSQSFPITTLSSGITVQFQLN
ncbi:MAG TPA: cell surface protein SprA [Saprospiraceae bacterium]|nr:cell surface protein SprA [Saprospiraceae bacterium]HPI05538.1 cell surface protein SprA [Saprospiraceae bacterium]